MCVANCRVCEVVKAILEQAHELDGRRLDIKIASPKGEEPPKSGALTNDGPLTNKLFIGRLQPHINAGTNSDLDCGVITICMQTYCEKSSRSMVLFPTHMYQRITKQGLPVGSGSLHSKAWMQQRLHSRIKRLTSAHVRSCDTMYPDFAFGQY